MAISCAACGQCGCGCQCGVLPYTMTVEVEGMAPVEPGPYTALIINSFPVGDDGVTGFGATGYMVEPGGCNGASDGNCSEVTGPSCQEDRTYQPSDRGPLTKVELRSGGCRYATLGRVEPTITASGQGDGATFTVELEQKTRPFHIKPYWIVKDVKVTGGSGFPNSSPLEITHSAGDTKVIAATGTVSATNGVPASVTITNAGEYYRESKDVAPYLSNVSVTVPSGIGELLPLGGYGPGGSGAAVQATVDDDPYSDTFGQIINLEITNAGTNYLAWTYQRIGCGEDGLNETKTVIAAKNPVGLISIEARSCLGSGACATPTPFGEYVQPTLKFSAPSGFGGTVTGVGLEYVATDDPIRPYWRLSDSVNATGGRLYVDGQALSLSFGPRTQINEMPLVTLSATPLIFEDLTDDIPDKTPGRPIGGGVLTGATVVSRGKMHVYNEYNGSPGPIKEITLAPGNGGSGYARKGRAEPKLRAYGPGSTVGDSSSYSPSISVQTAPNTDDCNLPYWSVSGVDITANVTNIPNGSPITFSTVTHGPSKEGTTKTIGAGTAVTDENGVLQNITITEPGHFYWERNDLPVITEPVDITIRQTPPSNGSGAVITAVVDEVPTSASFGKITKFNVTSGGSNYSIWGGSSDCTYEGCGFRLEYPGEAKKPILYYSDQFVRFNPGALNREFESSDTATDCDNPHNFIPVTSEMNAEFSATPGGDYDPHAPCFCDTEQQCIGDACDECNACCTGCCRGGVCVASGAFCPEPAGNITAKVSFPWLNDCEPVSEEQRALWYDLPDVVLTPAFHGYGGLNPTGGGFVEHKGWEGFYPVYDYSGCGYGGPCPVLIGWDPIYIFLIPDCSADCECNFVIFYPYVGGLANFPNYGPYRFWATDRPWVPALSNVIECGETPPSTCMKGLTRPPAGKYESAYYWNPGGYYAEDGTAFDCVKKDCLWQVILE